MHVHLPKPLHGWREFAGEVGIIVLGVLIALSAEQAVEAIHWHHQVKDTRAAIDAELSHDLAALQYRLSERNCVDQRLAELDRWSKAIGSGESLQLEKPIDPPFYFAIRTSVWDSTTGDVTSRMPLDAKLNYANLYGAMKTFLQLLDEESDDWARIKSYDGNRDLDRHELHEVQGAIIGLRIDNDFLPVFGARTREFAGKLGLRPSRDLEGNIKQQMADRLADFCRPLL